MEKEPENIEDMLNLLPPSRQQIARRKLTKIAEENPDQHLLYELTYAKLVEIYRNTGNNITKSVEIVPTAENPALTANLESHKKDIISEVVFLRKDLSRLGKIKEDTDHIRACTDRTESKLDLLRPYRVKIAIGVLIAVFIAGAFAGWHANVAYEDYQYEHAQRAR